MRWEIEYPLCREYFCQNQQEAQLPQSRLGVKATTLKAKAKAKDLASKAKDDVKANVNMVRCSVKTSKHRRLLQGW